MALAALSLSGCYTARYYADSQPGGTHHEEGADFFLWRLVGEKEINLDAICPQGVSRWYNQAAFLNGFLQGGRSKDAVVSSGGLDGEWA